MKKNSLFYNDSRELFGDVFFKREITCFLPLTNNTIREPCPITDHQKSYGGGGGREFWNRRNFFSLSNSLYEFFGGHSMNIF